MEYTRLRHALKKELPKLENLHVTNCVHEEVLKTKTDWGTVLAHFHNDPLDSAFMTTCMSNMNLAFDLKGRVNEVMKHEYAHLLAAVNYNEVMPGTTHITDYAKIAEYQRTAHLAPGWRIEMKKMGLNPSPTLNAYESNTVDILYTTEEWYRIWRTLEKVLPDVLAKNLPDLR